MGGGGIYYLKAPNELLFEGFSGTRFAAISAAGLQIGPGVSNMLGASPDDCCVLVSALVRAEDHLLLVQHFQ